VRTDPGPRSAGTEPRHVDLLGVGIGPFNLGLAALADRVEGLDAVFLDSGQSFSWHPGLMLAGTTLQVPFLADLVTMADPTNPYSFLNYLHTRGRLLRFFFHERFLVPRAEFDAYCRWVTDRLDTCRFGHTVTAVRPAGEGWIVEADGPLGRQRWTADHVVMGIGTRPWLPDCALEHRGPTVLHTADYLRHRDRALDAASVTVIGSGQSSGEVFCDLLEQQPSSGSRLDWFTRSRGFLPMEYSKLGLEHFSPEYTRYFHGLPEDRRDEVRVGQDLLYKGLSTDTSARIYDLLYERTVDAADPPVSYRSACDLRSIEPGDDDGWRLGLHHVDEDRAFEHGTEVVIVGTGYEPRPLPVDKGVMALDSCDRPVVELDYRVRRVDGERSTLFVQNGELHTHGVGAPDLTLGTTRNAVILNAVCGRDVHPVPERTVFQSFGAPPAPSAHPTIGPT